MSTPPSGLWKHWLLIAAVFLGQTAWTWRKWPDVVVDYGHELYVPWRLTEGEVLYRDIVFPLGPASQYFMAVWFLAGGASLTTAIVANLVVLALLVILLHGVLRRLGDASSATVLVVFFLIVFGFLQYTQIGNYNFVTPYRHEVTHGLTLCVLQVWALARWREGRRRDQAAPPQPSLHWLALSSVACGLTLLVKAEFALPAIGVMLWTFVTHGLGRPSRAGSGSNRRLSVLESLALVVPALMVGLIAWALLATQMPTLAAADALLINWRLAFTPELTTGSGFYRTLAGLTDVPSSLMSVGLSIGANLLVLAIAFLTTRLVRPTTSARDASVILGISVVIVGLSLCLLRITGTFMVPGALMSWVWNALPPAFPLIDAAVLLYCTVRCLRSSDASGHLFLLGAWAMLATLLCPKMLLTLGWGHYGFVLCVPSAMLVLHLFVFEIPRCLQPSAGVSSEGGRAAIFRTVATGLILTCAGTMWLDSARANLVKTLALGDGADQYFVPPLYDRRAVPTHRLLRYLKGSMAPQETLLVIPDGTMINFLLRKRNPTGHVLLSPWESSAYGDDVIYKAVVRHPPDVIVYFDESMAIHGRGEFGSPQYAARLWQWIQKEYHPVEVFEHSIPGGTPYRAYVFRPKPRQT